MWAYVLNERRRRGAGLMAAWVWEEQGVCPGLGSNLLRLGNPCSQPMTNSWYVGIVSDGSGVTQGDPIVCLGAATVATIVAPHSKRYQVTRHSVRALKGHYLLAPLVADWKQVKGIALRVGAAGNAVF